MRLLIPSLFAAVCACAQSATQLEIRGTVVEGALGIGGVTVTLYEFGHTAPEATTRSVFATTSTDATGKFTLHPARAGEYYLEVKKDGYFAESFDGPTVDPVDSTGDPVSIDQDHPLRERKFSLMRLGEVRGRVLDEDGKPMANIFVMIRPPASSAMRSIAQARTDRDGYFAATKLRPGDYLVEVAHKSPEILPRFSEEDLKAVDQDFEASSWPSAPLPVRSGASMSVGTITLRKGFYYRAHIQVSGDCAPGEKWAFSATPAMAALGFPVPCGKDFLVRYLAPGSYVFTLSSGPAGERKRWAIAPVEVTDRNIEATLSMSEGADLTGRLVTADGAALPLGRTMIVVSPVTVLLAGSQTTATDPGGKFVIRGVPALPHRVNVVGLAGKFFVKEIRYNSLVAADGILTPIIGAPAELEILIDDQAAIINGSVAERDNVTGRVMVLALKWPVSLEGMLLLMATASAPADDQGRFQIGGLAPGEYRVLAVTGDMLTRFNGDASRLVNIAEKVTLERGGSQSISLKITEP